MLFGAATFAVDLVVSPATPAPRVSPGFLASAGWYCPARSGDGVDAWMTAANLGRRTVRLRRLAVGDGAESPSADANLAPRRKNSLALSQFNSPNALGLTEAFGGGITADIGLVSKGKGVGSSLCSDQPGDRWLFATGSTTRRQDTYLLVGNPFQEEAVIQVKVLQPDKELLPTRLKDFVVPALSQVSLYLSDFLLETPSFGIEVTATQGRIVASRYLEYATREGVRGTSLSAGLRQPEVAFHFAGGAVPADGEETLVLVNPNPKEALLNVIFQTDAAQVAPTQLDEVAVPAGRQVKLKISDFLPRGTLHGTKVFSTNGIGVVAERETVAAIPGGKGYETVFGVPGPSRRWVVTAGSSAASSDSLAIVNNGKARASVDIALLLDKSESRPKPLRAVRVDSDRRQTVDLTPHLPPGGATAVVTSVKEAITVENQVVLGPPYSDFAASPGKAVP
ncbi:MAG: DUF5719 family protein [Actinomycetota bacterium]